MSALHIQKVVFGYSGDHNQDADLHGFLIYVGKGGVKVTPRKYKTQMYG